MESTRNNRRIGTDYEKKAAGYLEQHGYEILECNFRCRQGEIDLIAREGDFLCFVEVKYRTSGVSGAAACAVNYPKQQKIVRVARYYMMRHGLDEWTPCRFDVVAIDGETVTLYKNAFQTG